MPVTEQQKATPVSVIKDVVGEHLTALYVVSRHPLSGQLLDSPALIVIVDKHRAEGKSYVSELSRTIADRTGTYHQVFVYAADERDQLALDEAVEI